MQPNASWKACALAAAALLALGGAVGAQVQVDPQQVTIPAGIDIWTTPNGGAYVEEVTILPGFFCRASQGRTVDIQLKGKPIVTAPAGVLGTTDTVVYRSQNAVFSGNGTATVPIEVVGLHLVGSAPFDVPECSQSYTVVVCRGPNQPTGNTMTIALNGAQNGGTFSANLAVAGTVSFVGGGQTLTLGDEVVNLVTSNAHWANQAGTGGVNHSGSVQLDQGCTGQAGGTSYPGTSGFHPGWSWNPPPSHACPTPPCVVPTPHDGPHPVTLPPTPPPPPPCPHPDVIAVKLKEAQVFSASSVSGSQSLSFTAIAPCRIQITDSAVTSTDGANCTAGDLAVEVEGSSRSFTVVSRDPCVLDL